MILEKYYLIKIDVYLYNLVFRQLFNDFLFENKIQNEYYKYVGNDYLKITDFEYYINLIIWQVTKEKYYFWVRLKNQWMKIVNNIIKATLIL